MDFMDLTSLNDLSLESNISSGFEIFEDILFWERLKFDWLTNYNSQNDFAFTFFDDDTEALLLAHSDLNVLRHLLAHWRDMATRHISLERLSLAEYRFMYWNSLRWTSSLWEFLQYEAVRTGENMEAASSYGRLHRAQSCQIGDSNFVSRVADLPQRRSVILFPVDGTHHRNEQKGSQAPVERTDPVAIDFIEFLSSLNQNLALYLLTEGPRTIPMQFRPLYKNLMQLFCKAHSLFLPTIMQMKKNDKMRPVEYEGVWDSDAVCAVCMEMRGAFLKRCCEMVICEHCFTKYLNYQVTNFNRIHIECPSPSCQKPIRFQSIWIRLSEGNRKIYEVIKNNQEQNEFKKLCPHCMQFYELSDDEKNQLKKKKYKKLFKKGFNVKCHMCQWEWCFKCQTPVHGLTCKKNLSTDKLLMRWANSPLDNRIKKARKCPNCHILVERNGGCPHMECSKCKCEWCFDCGNRRIKIKHVPFLNHDSRFFILGCPKNLLQNRPHLRRFVRICVFCGITVLIIPASAIAAVVLVALGILLGIPFGFYMLGAKMRKCSCTK